MTKSKKHTVTTVNGYKLKTIELISASLDFPASLIPKTPIATFNYSVNLEAKVDKSNQHFIVVVTVEIKNEEQSHTLGSITVSCLFTIDNFDEVFNSLDASPLNMKQSGIEAINSISISTTRGVMFSTFKGTLLHNAILPVIDSESFKQVEAVK